VETSHARRAPAGAAYITAAVTGIAVLIVVAAFSAAGFFMSTRGSGTAASLLHAQPGSLRWSERDRVTMLIMLTGADTPRNSATEAMMVVSYDPAMRSLAMLSIPGTLWVTVPGYGQTELAQAYAIGGTRLALLTVESATHTVIPYYMVMGPSGWRQMIDASGGVKLRLPRFAAGRALGDQVARAGVQSLDGAAAFAYLHLATSGGSNQMTEMLRVHQVSLALKQQGLSAANLVRIPDIVAQVAGSIATNFPFDQMPDLARAVSRVPASQTTFARLDFADRSVTPYQGRWLLPDWQRIQSLSQSLFPLAARGAPVAVLNGSGVPGQAGTVATYLSQARVPVGAIGTAPSSGFTITQVMTRPGAGSAALSTARAVASLLQVPIVSGSVGHIRSRVVLIIGGDYQDLAQH
jgi:LCP family protein required for cell wall assembly